MCSSDLGDVTINPDQVDTTWKLGEHSFSIPFLAAAMDGVVDPSFAIAFHKFGGLAVMNLEGVQCRYDNPDEVLERIATASREDVTALMQQIYSAPVKDNLIAESRCGDKVAIEASSRGCSRDRSKDAITPGSADRKSTRLNSSHT